MSTYTSFAVLGAGDLGKRIIEALAAAGATVIVLTRPGSAAKSLPAGIISIPVEYTDVSSLTTIFKEHKTEVIVSTVGALGIVSQRQVAEAGKAAGATLFVPSEFGLPTEGITGGLLGEKNDVAKYLESIGLASARFYVGLFIHYIPWLIALSENDKFNIIIKNGRRGLYTSEEDIAGFLAHVLTTKPPATLANKSFHIAGDRGTLEEIAALFKKEVNYVDAIPGEYGELKTQLQIGFTKPNAEAPDLAGSSNGLWEGHKWKSIKEVYNFE